MYISTSVKARSQLRLNLLEIWEESLMFEHKFLVILCDLENNKLVKSHETMD